jgi:WD40 repeat protein
MLIFKAHAKPITALAFSPDGRMVVTASGTERNVRVWDIGAGDKPKKLHEWPLPFSNGVGFSSDSKIVVAGAAEGVRAWDLENDAALIVEAKFSAHKLCVSPSDVVFAHSFMATKRFSLRPKGKELPGEWKGEDPKDDNYGAGPIACTADGKRVAAHFSPKNSPPASRFVMRDTTSGEIVGRFDREHVSVQPARARFSSDNRFFATSYGAEIVVWDVETGKTATTLSVGKKHVPDVAFTTNSTRLIATSNDETVRQWDTKTWKEKDVYTWKVGKLTVLDVSSDGCRIASAGALGKVIIWDAA